MVDKEMKERVKRYRRLMKSAHTLETEREMMDLDFTFTCMDLAGADQQYLLPWQKLANILSVIVIAGFLALIVSLVSVHLFHVTEFSIVYGVSTAVFGTILIFLYFFKLEAVIGKAVDRYRAKRINAWLNSERWE